MYGHYTVMLGLGESYIQSLMFLFISDTFHWFRIQTQLKQLIFFLDARFAPCSRAVLKGYGRHLPKVGVF